MRLLVCTQAVDKDERALGFFHRWLEGFSRHADEIEVICLREGRHELPSQVHVHSLGKEQGHSRATYVWRFYRHMWRLRHGYDAVFVHMNQEYVLMGALIWKMLGKRVVLWRNHKQGSVFTDLACALVDAVCYTSPESYVAQKARAHQMSIGIDTDQFAPAEVPPPAASILVLGRLDPVKRVKEFAEALVLVARRSGFSVDIVGSPTDAASSYPAEVRSITRELEEKGMVRYLPGISHEETPRVYGAHDTYVNVTPSGSFDKTIGEAMASGCVVVAANRVIRGVVPDALLVDPDSPADIARGIEAALGLSAGERAAVIGESRDFIERRHSLAALMQDLAKLLGQGTMRV